MKVVVISDTHGDHPAIPPGDFLIHCGDITHFGSFAELRKEVGWLKSLPHTHKIFCPGNHDVGVENIINNGMEEKLRAFFQQSRVNYLRDAPLEIDGVRFYGFPWTLPVGGVFQAEENDLEKHLSKVTGSVDVLISHGPPFGILDAGWGSKALAKTVEKIRPRFHVFGHAHEGVGMERINGTLFCNAAKQPFTFEL
jgi:Icc-related predicted phosphoesterase